MPFLFFDLSAHTDVCGLLKKSRAKGRGRIVSAKEKERKEGRRKTKGVWCDTRSRTVGRKESVKEAAVGCENTWKQQ